MQPTADSASPAGPSGGRAGPGRRQRVAVLGCDSPIGLTIIRELGLHGIEVLALGRSARAIGRFSRYAADFATYTQPLDECLPELLAARQVSAIMGISEGDLLQLAQLKGRLGGVQVICPEATALAMVFDKQRTLDIAEGLGISVPRSWHPRLGEDFAALAAGLAFPVAIKWPDPPAIAARLAAAGLALEKVEYADNADQLLAILQRYAALGEWPLVQSWCPGYGLGQMLQMHRGSARLRFQHRRLREWPPSGGVSTLCEAIPPDQHQAQMALSERLLQQIGWEGPAMVEYRHDPASGRYWLMEINGRFWGSIPLAHHAGAHFAWDYLCSQTGIEAPPAPPPKSQCRARYVIPDAKHLLAVLRDGQRSRAKRLRIALGFLADFADPRVRYFVWSIRDPRPFVADMGAIVRKLLRRDNSAAGG